MNSLAAPPNMAFKHGLSERLDELRFPSPRSPPSDSTFPGYSPLSPGTSNFTGFSRPITDVRANLQRRFTTDSSKLSSWSYLSQGASQEHDPLDMLSSVSAGNFFFIVKIFFPQVFSSLAISVSCCILFFVLFNPVRPSQES